MCRREVYVPSTLCVCQKESFSSITADDQPVSPLPVRCMGATVYDNTATRAQGGFVLHAMIVRGLWLVVADPLMSAWKQGRVGVRVGV